jgi:hypothetical protein
MKHTRKYTDRVWKGDLASYGFLLQDWPVHKFAFKIKIDDKNSYHNRDYKVTPIMLVWACTENGRKQNSQNSNVYEFGNKKTKR